MKKIALLIFAIFLISSELFAQDPPILSSWIRNTTNYTGYNGILADVQQVRYSANYVYINSTGIPNYNIGPWNGNPNVPTNQAYVFKFSRNPVENTGTKTSTPLGVIGTWINGVAIFNPRDAMSYNNQNIWHQNAVTVEGPSFDACKGHPAPGGAYHNHEDPACLHGFNPSEHSPVIGYLYDGFPVYGPFGYSNPNGTGGISRMRSGYRLRNITLRTTLADGTVLPANQYGPPVSATYPLEYYIEDYEYILNLGDLDKYNGRFCVTPEYPGGIYAYFISNDSNNIPVYPYITGPQYYGVVTTENISSMGHVTVTEPVQTYNPLTSIISNTVPAQYSLHQNYPNPFNPSTTIVYDIQNNADVKLSVFDITGREVAVLVNEKQQAGTYSVKFISGQFNNISSGIYIYKISASSASDKFFIESKKMLIIK